MTGVNLPDWCAVAWLGSQGNSGKIHCVPASVSLSANKGPQSRGDGRAPSWVLSWVCERLSGSEDPTSPDRQSPAPHCHSLARLVSCLVCPDSPSLLGVTEKLKVAILSLANVLYCFHFICNHYYIFIKTAIKMIRVE